MQLCEKKTARTQCPFMLCSKTNSVQVLASPTWETNRLLHWIMPQILPVLKYRCCFALFSLSKKWEQWKKVRTLPTGFFILLTFEAPGAFIRLSLRCLVSSARRCWQRLLCQPQRFPQLPEPFKAEELGIYNRVRPQVKLQVWVLVLPWGLFKDQTGILWIDPLNALQADFYPGLSFQNSHVPAGARWRMSKVLQSVYF